MTKPHRLHLKQSLRLHLLCDRSLDSLKDIIQNGVRAHFSDVEPIVISLFKGSSGLSLSSDEWVG